MPVIDLLDADYYVYVDGKQVEDVVRADEAAGEVEILERDFRTGEYVANPDGTASSIVLRGKVQKEPHVTDADRDNIVKTISRIYREEQDRKTAGLPRSCTSFEFRNKIDALWERLSIGKREPTEELTAIYQLMSLSRIVNLDRHFYE